MTIKERVEDIRNRASNQLYAGNHAIRYDVIELLNYIDGLKNEIIELEKEDKVWRNICNDCENEKEKLRKEVEHLRIEMGWMKSPDNMGK